jgi:hypothetical protein
VHPVPVILDLSRAAATLHAMRITAPGRHSAIESCEMTSRWSGTLSERGFSEMRALPHACGEPSDRLWLSTDLENPNSTCAAEPDEGAECFRCGRTLFSFNISSEIGRD